MPLEYYKFAMESFGVTPNPAFLFLSPTHREALASMVHGIRSGRGFTVQREK
jgi:general secretion pathway protein A